ncbi:putative mitochondrial protein, partial [Mucuna pruriens]
MTMPYPSLMVATLFKSSEKEQIEVMVFDMLVDGVIQPNTSPFSSPILLVKKKDSLWHFCVTMVLEWPEPNSIKQLCGFLGCTCYYKCLIKGYATIAFPLATLLKKDNF